MMYSEQSGFLLNSQREKILMPYQTFLSQNAFFLTKYYLKGFSTRMPSMICP